MNIQSEKFIVCRKKDLENDDVEAICATVKIDKEEEFLLVTAYIPPGKSDQLKAFIELVKKCNRKYKNIILTGDFNAKSKFWGNRVENYAGELLEKYMCMENFICINDGVQTRRNSDCVIDLFIIKPHLNRKIKQCLTLTHETVRSDHIAVLMEIEGGESEDFEEVEKYRVHKTDWEKWDTTTSSAFSKWLSEIQMNSNMETLYDSFLAVFETCMKECTPKANVKISNRRKIPGFVK